MIWLKEYIDYKELSVFQFEKKLEVRSTIDKAIKTGSNLRSDILAKILFEFPDVNPDWLLTGKGEMLKSNTSTESNRSNDVLIPLYDGVVTASMLENDMRPQTQPVEYVNAGDWFRDATAAMRVHGDSMYPEYQSGSIVALKEVFNKRLIIYGQDYLIETSEYRVIKRLQKSNEKNSWLACSLNQEIWESGELQGRLIHEPFDINLDDVIRIYQVVGSVRRNHSSRIVKV